jgi:hypothetical protein
MPLNKIDITFTAPQETAIGTAIADLNTNFPFAQNLTNAEKKQYPTTDNSRLPYVKRTVEIHAVNMPVLVSGFAGTLLNAQNDWKLFNQIENFKQQLLSYIEKLNETQDVAGAELYQFMLGVYKMAKEAADNNVPGAQAVVDDLAPLFEGQGAQPQVP